MSNNGQAIQAFNKKGKGGFISALAPMALMASGAGLAGLAVVTALSPAPAGAIAKVADILNRIGLDKGPLLLFGATIGALGFALIRVERAGRAAPIIQGGSGLSEQIMDDLEGQSAIMASLQGELGAARSEIAELRRETQESSQDQEQEENAASDPIFRLAASLDQLGAQIGKHLDSVARNMEASIQAVQSSVQAVQTSLQTVDSNVQVVQSGLQTVDSNVQVVQSGLQTVDSNVQVVQSGLQTVDSGVQAVQSNAQRFETGLQEVQSSVQTCEQRMAELASGGQDGSVGEHVATELSSMRSEIATLTMSMNSLAGQVEAIEIPAPMQPEVQLPRELEEVPEQAEAEPIGAAQGPQEPLALGPEPTAPVPAIESPQAVSSEPPADRVGTPMDLAAAASPEPQGHAEAGPAPMRLGESPDEPAVADLPTPFGSQLTPVMPAESEFPSPPAPMPKPSEGLDLIDDMNDDTARIADLTPPLFPELGDGTNG